MTLDDMQELFEEPKARLESALAAINRAIEAKSKKVAMEAWEESKGETEDALDLLNDIDPDGN